MIKNLFFLTSTFLAFSSMLYAQSPSYKLPAYRTEKEIRILTERNKNMAQATFGERVAMPEKVRYPGEFEESQAVVIAWAEDYVNGGMTVDTHYVYGYISAQLAKHISDEIPVWIRIFSARDSNMIKAYMTRLGWPLVQNYRFFIAQGDAWWIRDYGPNGVYTGDRDDLAFVDLKYFDLRFRDNLFPKVLANYLGIPHYESLLRAEGGNLMSDGFGKVFFSDIVTGTNDWLNGWNDSQTFDTISNLLGATEHIKLSSLQCDGGTRHIDLYTKLIDEQTILVMEYPEEITSQDKNIIEDNYQYLTTLRSVYDRPYRIIRFPMPTGDDGTYNRKTCNEIDQDARTYINGVILNKTFIYPVYSNNTNGNQAQTEESVNLYKKCLPGYKVIPIDVRDVSPLGGSIHCITMQIPANNPVLFWHPSVDGHQPIQPGYLIQAKITNHSGIAAAECKWKKRGTDTWNTLTLSLNSEGVYTGNLIPGALTVNDTIDYYLTATTNNGKTAVKPITAPAGFYTIIFTDETTGIDEGEVRAKNYLFGAYPNPANDHIYIPYQLLQASDVIISIMDMSGKEVIRINKNVKEGFFTEELDINELGNGIYFYTLYANHKHIGSRKFSVQY